MLTFLKTAVDDGSADQRAKIGAIYALLIAGNALVWAWAVIALAGRPTLLGTAVLAYVLGLRHAVDADHIAAIDNVVRKLMQEGKRPLAVGLFFSLGHSLVVVLAVAAIATAAFALRRHFHAFKLSAASSAPRLLRSFCSPLRRSISSFCAAFGGAFGAPAVANRSPNMNWTFSSPAAVCLPAFSARCSAWFREAGRCFRSGSCSASASIPRPRSACLPSRPARRPTV